MSPFPTATAEMTKTKRATLRTAAAATAACATLSAGAGAATGLASGILPDAQSLPDSQQAQIQALGPRRRAP